MTYFQYESSVDSGDPFFLYVFAYNKKRIFYTAETETVVLYPGFFDSEYFFDEEYFFKQEYIPNYVSHSVISQSGNLDRVDNTIKLSLNDGFAKSMLGPAGAETATVVIARGHRGDPDSEVLVQWQGRVVEASVDRQEVALRCESVFTSMRRSGLRPKFTRSCRHALYQKGCGVDLSSMIEQAQATSISGLVITVPDAATHPDGWYKGGFVKFENYFMFVLRHVGDQVSVRSVSSEFKDAFLSGVVDVGIAPGCDLTLQTCADKFSNSDNYGGNPWMPRKNPFGSNGVS